MTYTEIHLMVNDIAVKVIYKKIKNIRLTISLKDKSVIVSAPNYTNLLTIKSFLQNKYTWLEKSINKIPNVDKISYTKGSQLSILGKQVIIKSKQEVFDYKHDFQKYVESRIKFFSQILKVNTNWVKIKPLKSKWGSCNISEKGITINFYLIHSSNDIIDYVIYHELVHLIEKGHNKRFYSIIEAWFDNYKELDKKLGELQLALP